MATTTRTHTVYFSDDNSEIVRLRSAHRTLLEDAARRRTYITREAYAAIQSRLVLLRAAIDLLTEPVPPSYGG